MLDLNTIYLMILSDWVYNMYYKIMAELTFGS